MTVSKTQTQNEPASSPEEAVCMNAVACAFRFVHDSKRDHVERMWSEARETLSDELGFEVDDTFLVLWRRVFTETVAAIVDWDFATGFEHDPAPPVSR